RRRREAAGRSRVRREFFGASCGEDPRLARAYRFRIVLVFVSNTANLYVSRDTRLFKGAGTGPCETHWRTLAAWWDEGQGVRKSGSSGGGIAQPEPGRKGV